MLFASDFSDLGRLGIGFTSALTVGICVGVCVGGYVGRRTRWYYGVLAAPVSEATAFFAVIAALFAVGYLY
jgi:hypothetical protein